MSDLCSVRYGSEVAQSGTLYMELPEESERISFVHSLG
jgi:hypothetical protein